MAALYRVGERVDGLYDENADDMWYPGRIRCVRAGEAETDGAFEVVYDDGEVELNVRPEFLRQHVPGTICVGTRVLCRYDGGDEFYPGQVSDVQEDGKYTIAYDDGEVEADVPLDHIMEPEGEENKDAGEEEAASEGNEPSEATDDPTPARDQQQQDEEAGMEEAPLEPVDNTMRKASEPSESEESVSGENRSDEAVTTEALQDVQPPRAEQSPDDEPPQRAIRNEDHPEPAPTGVSAERAYIVESLQLLEKRLGDAASTKSVLSTLVKQMRAYPQVTAELVHERGGERLIVDALKFHQSHAVIQCYGFVLLRRLCFLCVKSTNFLLRNGIVELVIQAMNAFAEDAILQASACGALAVFTRVQTGLNTLVEYQVAQLVLSTLIYHKTYSVHTRQVHYYACEVLLELCELDDLQTLSLLCGEQEEDFTGDMSPISLLLFLLRQGLSLDDKKACCAVGSLLMCLAASGRRAAALVVSLNGLAELSTVMARYPTEPSIQKYSSAASKQIALSSVRQSPTKRIKDTAKEILREAESLEKTPADRPPAKRSAPRRSTSTGKRKSIPTAGYGAPAYPRGAAYSSNTSHRSAQGGSQLSSPYAQPSPRFGGDTSSCGYPARDFGTAPQPPSSLVILDGGLGMDNGAYASASKRKQLSKEDRQSELFDAYGIQEMPTDANGRPYGTKRAQLRAHLASAESAWAAPQPYGHSASKPYSSRSEHLEHGPAHAQGDFPSSRQNGWAYDNDEPQNSVYDPELRQPRGAKRKKRNPGTRTAFQVKVENDNQLRVSRETRSPYPSPQRLGVATKRAAKARQKRITGGGQSTLTGRSNNASSESLNDYATQLFQENASRAGAGALPTSSKLTPREKEEIRERERLSFAEKLHKMIDKAKSTLANGNTTSVAPVDDARRPHKSGATSKPVRKAREDPATPSQDKRPQSKKTRTAVSTPKNTAKEVSSPRDAAETRPPKPATGTSKRQQDVGSQPPTSSRTKPSTSRPVLPPKVATDPKPRSAAKPGKTSTTKGASKRGDEKSNAETVLAEAAAPSTPVVGDPQQVEMAAAEPAVSAIQPPSEEAAASLQVEPEVSTSADAAKQEEAAVPLEIAAEPRAVVPEAEHQESLTEEQPPQLLGDGETEVVTMPAEVEVVAPRGDEPLAKDEDSAPATGAEAVVEAATELPDPPVETTEAATEERATDLQSVDDHPAAASAIADAMYGDTFSEFDDNGGDDEDATTEAGADTEDAPSPVTEAAADAPLQESKSGEALYDDGYDEFDEDEAPTTEDAEAEAAETVDNQDVEVADAISQLSEDVPAASAHEVEADQLVAQSEDPSPAAVDETAVASSTDGGEGDPGHSLVSVDEKDDSVDVTPAENEDAAALPEEATASQCDEANTENAAQSAPSASDPVVNDTGFGEQDESELTSEDTSPALEPSGESVPEDAPSADEERVRVDETADDGTASERVEDSPVGEDAVECEVEPSDANVEVGTERVCEDAESCAQPAAVEIGDPSASPPGASLDLASDETAVHSAVEGQANEGAATDAHADETLQDGELKTLSADNSSLSIQSAAYEEENFDDEESHQEEKPSEATEVDPASVAAEDGVDEVTPEQGDAKPDAMEARVEAEPASEDRSASEQGEDEAKTLAANSSEVSVQSAGYEDEDFDDGAHEEALREVETGASEEKPGEHEPSEDEVAKSAELDESVAPVEDSLSAPISGGEEEPNEVVADAAASTAVPERPEDEDPGNTALEGLSSEPPVEFVAMEEPSEQQQLEHDGSTAASDVVAEPSLTPTTSEEPDTMAGEELVNDLQESEANEADTYDVAAPVGNAEEMAYESDSAATADPVEGAELPPAAVESSAESSVIIDILEIAAPEIAIPSEPTREEAAESPATSAQPATYDDDDFDNVAEDESAPSSAATLGSGIVTEGCKGEDLTREEQDVRPSEQAIDEPDEDEAHEPAEMAKASPVAEPEQSDESVPSPPEGAVDSGVALVEANDSVPDETPESELAPVDPVQEATDQAEPPVTDGEASAPVEADSPMPDVASLEPELSTEAEQLGDEQAVTSLEDQPDVHAVSSGAEDGVAIPEPEAQAKTPIDAGGDDAPVEMTDQCADCDPLSADFPDRVEQPAVKDAQEQPQYEDAAFEDLGNDAPGFKDESWEPELVPSASSAGDEAAPADALTSGQAARVEEDEAAMGDAAEAAAELGISNGEEASALPAEVPASSEAEVSEATADTDGAVVDGYDQPRTDAAAEADERNDHVAESAADTSDATGVELEDTRLPAPDGTADEEDFPPDIPSEADGDASVDETTAPVGVEGVSSKATAAEDENNAGKPSEDGEAHAVAESTDDLNQHSGEADAAPLLSSKEECYDQGFEGGGNPPAADASDEGERIPPAEEEPASDAAAASVAESEQLHGGDSVDTGLDIHSGPEEADAGTEDCDVVNADEVEAALGTEPENSEPEAAERAAVEQGDHAELDESKAAAAEPTALDPEIIADKTEHAEPEVVASEAVEQMECVAAVDGKVSGLEATEPSDVAADQPVEDSPSVEPQATGPEAAETETLETEDVEPDAVEIEAAGSEQSETVESITAAEASEPALEEGANTEPAPAVPEAVAESPEVPASVVGDAADMPAAEGDLLDVPNEAADSSPLEPTEDAGKPKEETPHEAAADGSPRSEDPIASSSVDAPAGESPADPVALEPEGPAVLHAEGALEADLAAASATSPSEETGSSEAHLVAPQGDEGTADELQSAEEVAKAAVADSEVNEEPAKASPDSTTAESTPAEPAEVPTDEAQSTAEQSSGQPDYDEADFTDELPAAAVDEAKAVDEVAQEETPPTQDLPDVSAVAPREVQEDFPDASEEMAIEVEPPQPGQAAAEATPPASEGPKTEDQYEDDEGYFDDQDSESTAPAAVPSLEIPAPAAAATEDDYEEYENEDYGEEDKPSDTPRADPAPSSTRSEPPASAREEIEEVADGPEETEDEAYADEQDEYEDDEAAASRGNSPRAKKDQPPAQVEASADEYEEEDEEYAEDEIEDSSPSPASKSKPAAAAPPAKSDDEMDEEVGYDSEYGSDG